MKGLGIFVDFLGVF
uniref:Uncharacterized protein n=1 Tax=Arundo donax TaxID=35708 RepID=A0A0A9AMA6_ARUDO